MLMMVGAEPMMPTPWISGPSAAVNAVGVAVDALGVPVLGGHPEVPFDGLGHTVGQLVVEERPVAAQLGEQLVGKSVPPQGGIRQIDWCGRGHAGSWFGCP